MVTGFDGMWDWRYDHNPTKIEEIVSGTVTTTYIGKSQPGSPTSPAGAADADKKRQIVRFVENTTTGLTKREYPKVSGKDPHAANYQWSQRSSYSYSFD